MMIVGKTSGDSKSQITNHKSQIVGEDDANAECEVQNAELGDEGADNAECEVQSAELGDEEADNAECEVQNAELGDDGDCSSSLVALKAEVAAERDRYLRLAAEYDNFRKRSSKEREKIYSDARADVITRLLPVYDNIQRALKTECTDEAFFKGVEMMMSQLTQILDDMNVKQIPAVGEPFDPNRHNAVMMVENPDLGEKVVAEEYQKGFMLGERVIRHSTVVVAN